MYPVATMCRLLGVSASGYYAWQGRAPSTRAESDEALLDRIREIHRVSQGTYGAPRIHAELVAQGYAVGRKRVARLMRRAGLRGISRRKGTRTTIRDARARPAPDLVERDFTADAPDRLWVADITYIPTWAGFLFLAVVLDAFSRRVVGWSMANHLRTRLVLDALDMALWQRRPDGVIHHSDQGSQYTSIAFGKRCRDAGVRPSTGSVGDCYDNAMCARASSPPSNASCWSAAGSALTPKRGWPSSSSSRGGTTPDGATPPSDICHRSTTNGATYPPLAQIHDRPRNRGKSILLLFHRLLILLSRFTPTRDLPCPLRCRPSKVRESP